MEPIPETDEAVGELDPFSTEEDLLERLVEKSRQVTAVVPECVGVSVAATELGATFTLVASSEEIASLDAVQYVEGGPCVDEADAEGPVEMSRADLLDEEAWRTFAQVTAAHGVASTLTLPIMEGGRVIGTVNLYGATSSCFTGHHEELADIFAAWAPGAVANADLSFRTRREAERTPERLRARARVETAVGMIAAIQEVDIDAARDLLHDAAVRAGVEDDELAEVLLEVWADG